MLLPVLPTQTLALCPGIPMTLDIVSYLNKYELINLQKATWLLSNLACGIKAAWGQGKREYD